MNHMSINHMTKCIKSITTKNHVYNDVFNTTVN